MTNMPKFRPKNLKIEFKMDEVCNCSLLMEQIGTHELQMDLILRNQQNINDTIDFMWIMTCAFLVFLMQTGFTMLEAGGIARKSLLESILLKNVIDVSIASICFYCIGFAFAFGEDGVAPSFIGSSYFALTSKPPYHKFLSQWAYTSTATTIVSGAMAERTRIRAYVWYAILMSSFTYPIICHWVWSPNGWLSAYKTNRDDLFFANGLIDWAGGGVVHLLGGTAGAVGSLIVKKRMGRFEDLYERKGMFRPQNVGWMTLGTMILWFSWYGFNCGYAISNHSYTVARVAVTTTLSGTSAGIVALFWAKVLDKKWVVPALLNGILSGLVSITSGCSVIAPWGSIIVGVFAGTLYFWGAKLLVRIQMDDVLETAVVHGLAGLWGLIAIGLLATKENIKDVYGRDEYAGLLTGGGPNQLGMQLLGAVIIIAWSGIINSILWLVLRYFNQLRISERYEKLILEAELNMILSNEAAQRLVRNWQNSEANYVRNIDETIDETKEENNITESDSDEPSDISSKIHKTTTNSENNIQKILESESEVL